MKTNQVYFIECAGRIKIGTTKNLKSRLSALHTSSPGEIVVIATIPGDRRIERLLHAKLAAHRVKLEWFNDCVEVRAAIDEAVDTYRGTFSPDVNAAPSEAHLPPKPNAPQSYKPWQAIDHSAATMLTSTVSTVTDRFLALARSGAAQDGCHAGDLAHNLGLDVGLLLEQVYLCEKPAEAYGRAVRLLSRLFHKFTKVSARASLAVLEGDVSAATPLCRAAQILIDRAESAITQLKHNPAALAQVRTR